MEEQRNIEKELNIYQIEYMHLKAENVSLKALIDDLQSELNELKQLNTKREPSN